MNDDFWNLWPRVILFREGEEGDGGNSSEENSEDEDPDDEGDPENSNDDSPKTASGKTDKDFEELQNALAKERRANKVKERQLRAATVTKTTKEAEENETLEDAKKREAASNSKVEKLAAGILKRDIDSKIRQAARDLKFIDVEDAVNGVDRSAIVFDQDDEDPSDVDVDEDTVKAVVKALSVKKPHFINRGTSDGDPTGNPHGGSRRKKKQTDEEELMEHYPSL